VLVDVVTGGTVNQVRIHIHILMKEKRKNCRRLGSGGPPTVILYEEDNSEELS